MPGVVVVGSGAAGLAAALSARALGADVVVVERASRLGGTTAVSGGVVWAPGHHLGPPEDPAEATAYLMSLATGHVDRELVETFVGAAPETVRWLEEATPLRWSLLADWPDYHPEAPGGRTGGRSIWPEPFRAAPGVAALVQEPFAQPVGAPPGSARRPPASDAPGTAASPPASDGPGTAASPPASDGPGTAASPPASDGIVFRGPVRGRALVAGLLSACLEAGVEVRPGVRFTGLVEGGVRAGDETLEGRVVLACGGFQHSEDLRRRHLPGPTVVPLGTPGCAGDGLVAARDAGADLANLAEGWWMPALAVPGEELDGAAYYRPLHHERAQAGAVMVDGSGRRFVNEAQNYGTVGRAMLQAGAAPGWLVFDSRYRRANPIGPVEPGDAEPPWLVRAADPVALAGAIGVDSEALCATLARFNAAARGGRDPEFGRGSSHYDRWIAGGRPLAPVDEPPLYAVAVWPGCMGTKGGPRTDGEGRVLSAGRRLPGLYAAGNAAASPFGTATAAGGATIGPALVFGRRAGRAAVLD